MTAWQSTVTKITHFTSKWPETLVDVNGGNGADGADFAGASVAVLVTTIHLHIMCRAATAPKHVAVCNSSISMVNQPDAATSQIYFELTLYLFRTVFPSIIRSSRLYVPVAVRTVVNS
jgi:hypothetical protein